MLDHLSTPDITATNEAIKMLVSGHSHSAFIARNYSRQKIETAYITPPNISLNHEVGRTYTRSELEDGAAVVATNSANVAPNDELAPVHRNRTSLIVQKYAGKSSREDDARLEILTARIRRLDPRVSSAQLDVLSDLVTGAEEVSASMEEMRERLAQL